MERAIKFYEDFFEQEVSEKGDVGSCFEVDGFRFNLFAYKVVNEKHIFGSNCLPSELGCGICRFRGQSYRGIHRSFTVSFDLVADIFIRNKIYQYSLLQLPNKEYFYQIEPIKSSGTTNNSRIIPITRVSIMSNRFFLSFILSFR